MKTFAIILALLISTSSLAATIDPAYKVVKGPVQETTGVVTYHLNSDLINGDSRIQILRPDKPTNRILFLLPVTPWPGFEEKWKRLGSGMTEILKHDYHNRYGYNVVVPDFPAHMPWFVDHASDPKRQHETYMMTVVLPFTEKVFEIENPLRDLAGFSKAGFGSLSLLLRHPDIFHAASAWDPGGLLKPYNPNDDTGLSNTTGNQSQYDRYQLLTSIGKNAPHFQGGERIAISGHSNEAFLNRLRALRDMLDEKELSYIYTESVQVPHRWHTGWMKQALTSLQLMRD